MMTESDLPTSWVTAPAKSLGVGKEIAHQMVEHRELVAPDARTQSGPADKEELRMATEKPTDRANATTSRGPVQKGKPSAEPQKGKVGTPQTSRPRPKR